MLIVESRKGYKMSVKFIVISVFMATDKNFMNSINVPFSCISIVSPEYPQYETAKSYYCRDILYLRFHDVRADGNVASIYEVGDKIIPIDDSDARKIIEFGLKNKKHKNFMIHCEAGLSRSPAVALALAEILNDDRHRPEQYVETLYNIEHYNFDIKKKILDVYYEKMPKKPKPPLCKLINEKTYLDPSGKYNKKVCPECGSTYLTKYKVFYLGIKKIQGCIQPNCKLYNFDIL